MAKISTYPLPTPPSSEDLLIGTDISDANNTKNFKITDVLALTNKGSFFSTQTQTAASANTAYPIRLENTDTDITNGFTVNSGTNGVSRITANADGAYNLAFSAQINKTTGGEASIDIWIRIDGVNVANSNTRVTIKANANYMVAAWNFFVKLNEGQYVELMWATTDTNARFLYEAAGSPHPATPSVIATINQV